MSKTTNQPQSSRIDTLLTVLADEERRAIIAHLRDTPSATASLEGLAAAPVTNTDVDKDRARVRLHHVHLPKLADASLISYDMDTNTVEYHGHPALDPLMDSLPDAESIAHQ